MADDTPETSEAWDAVSRMPDGMYDSRVPISAYARAMVEHSRKMERQRDQYAAMLCEAMRVVYATTCVGDSTDLIDRFEALELTPKG